MAKKTTLAAGTSPFAHLLGGAAALAGRTFGKKAEEDTPIDEEGPTNEDDVEDEVEDVEGEPAEEDRAKKGRKAKGKKADDGDQDPEADADDADDADAESEDDKEQAAYQRGLAMGRARENTRCSRIFLAAGAAGRPDLAATLAFTSRTTSAEAGRLMGVAAMPTRRNASLDDRMAGRREARPGAGGGAPTGKATFGERMSAALKKAGR